MLVHQTTPFTKSTAVSISTCQTHINDIDALSALPKAPYINKAPGISLKPWKAQTWRLEMETQPAESPTAQPSGRPHEVFKNAPSATTAPIASVTPPHHPKLLAHLDKTLAPSFCFNTNINSSWRP